MYFADYLANVYALEAGSGDLVWKNNVGRHKDATVTGSVTVADGKVIVPLSSMEVAAAADPAYPCCKSSGAVAAVDASNGEETWYYRVIQQAATEQGKTSAGITVYAPSGAPVWSSPTVDIKRSRVYIGTGENYSYPATDSSDALQALDLASGELIWSFQRTKNDAYNSACSLPGAKANCPQPEGPDHDFGMAPVLLQRDSDSRHILVAGQKSGMVFGLDPDKDGELLWETRVGSGSTLGGIHWGVAGDGKYAYVTNTDHPRTALPAEFKQRGRTPGVYALDLNDGSIAWQHSSPADTCDNLPGCFRGNSAAPTAIAGVVFAGGLDGILRAFNSDTGEVIWWLNTAREYSKTINGIPGKGGAIDGPGPVIANGRLFVNSGYGLFTQMPGNVLLAFEVKKQNLK